MPESLREQIDQVFSGYGSELLAWKSWGMNAVEKTHDLKVESVDQMLSLIIKKAKGTKNPHPQQICVLTPGFTPKIKLNPDYLLFNEAIQAMIKELSDG